MAWKNVASTVVSSVVALTVFIAAPVSATRQIAYDDPSKAISFSACSIDRSCDGISHDDFSSAGGTRTNLNFSTVYVYKQGVVSFDNALTAAELSADQSAGNANSDSTTFFAPGYSEHANYNVTATLTNSYGDGSGYGLLFSFSDGTATPVFQLLMATFDYGATTEVHFLYPGGDPVQGALIGYNVGVDLAGGTQAMANHLVTNDRIDFAASNFPITITDYGVNATDDFHIVNLTAAAVPEPESWALMIVGFGLAGWTMRRSRRSAMVPA